jgi:hypothetical protein
MLEPDCEGPVCQIESEVSPEGKEIVTQRTGIINFMTYKDLFGRDKEGLKRRLEAGGLVQQHLLNTCLFQLNNQVCLSLN